MHEPAAREGLIALAEWIRLSSRSSGRSRGEPVEKGPFATIVPTESDDSPAEGFDPEALALFVPTSQTTGVKLSPIDKGKPASQPLCLTRLEHLIWKVGAGELPPCRFIGLSDPLEPLGGALERVGVEPAALDTLPLIGVRLWTLNLKHQKAITSRIMVFAR